MLVFVFNLNVLSFWPIMNNWKKKLRQKEVTHTYMYYFIRKWIQRSKSAFISMYSHKYHINHKTHLWLTVSILFMFLGNWSIPLWKKTPIQFILICNTSNKKWEKKNNYSIFPTLNGTNLFYVYTIACKFSHRYLFA